VIRRIALAAAAAVALVAVPSAAMAAYEGPPITAVVSDTTPASGSPFTVTADNATPNGSVELTVTSDPTSISSDTITIAGAKSFAKTANASGVAVFTVTVTEAGTYALTVRDVVSNQVISTQSVRVAAAGTALSETGFGGFGTAAGAGLLLLVGTALVLISRRRAATDDRELAGAGR